MLINNLRRFGAKKQKILIIFNICKKTFLKKIKLKKNIRVFYFLISLFYKYKIGRHFLPFCPGLENIGFKGVF